MKNILSIGQKITLDGKIYKAIGIDSYVLTNLYDQKREWRSYTLITDGDEKIWLGHGIDGDLFLKQWLISETEFKEKTEKLPLNAEYSGIAHISFEGNQGYSVPTSEIIWFNFPEEQYDYLIIERFLEADGDKVKLSKPYYHGTKIVKNIAIE